MYDLHAHILPAVDDGAKTIEDSLSMSRVAAAGGTRVMLATPHRKDVTEGSSVEYISGLVDEINELNRQEGIELELVRGMENHLDLDLPQEIKDGRALPMNGTKFILVEMPFFGRPNWVEDILFQIQLMGFRPVLAHPERIEAFQKDVELLALFVERGMISQVTAGSILGYFGGKTRDFTRTLMRRRLVHVLASDTHLAEGRRSPKLTPGIEAAAKIVGDEAARAMAVDMPKAILQGGPVDVPPPEAAEHGRRWWRFWS